MESTGRELVDSAGRGVDEAMICGCCALGPLCGGLLVLPPSGSCSSGCRGGEAPFREGSVAAGEFLGEARRTSSETFLFGKLAHRSHSGGLEVPGGGAATTGRGGSGGRAAGGAAAAPPYGFSPVMATPGSAAGFRSSEGGTTVVFTAPAPASVVRANAQGAGPAAGAVFVREGYADSWEQVFVRGEAGAAV